MKERLNLLHIFPSFGVGGAVPATGAVSGGSRAGRWFPAVQFAIVATWLSWDFTIHRFALGCHLLPLAVTVALAATYLVWFRARERRVLDEVG